MTSSLSLLTPGPVEVHPNLIRATNGLFHRSSEFRAIVESLFSDLAATTGAAEYVLLPVGGTGALEIATSHLIGRRETVGVLSNGEFGDRLAVLCRQCTKDVIFERLDEGQPITAREVESLLAGAPPIRWLVLCAHETSTAIVNDIASAVAGAHRHSVRVLIDGVSAIYSERTDHWHKDADAVVWVSGKGAGALPGVSVLRLREAGIEIHARDTVAFSLERQRASQRRREFAFTPPVSVVAAFGRSLAAIARRSLPAHVAEGAARTAQLRVGFERYLWPANVPDFHRSLTVSAFLVDGPPAVFSEPFRKRGLIVHATAHPNEVGRSVGIVATMGFVESSAISRARDVLRGLTDDRTLLPGSQVRPDGT